MTVGHGEVAEPPVALYVHVPFCVSLCPYCDFVVLAGSAARGPRNRIAAFVEALETELHLRADRLDAAWGPPGVRPALRSLYLGGGTPTLLPAEGIGRLVGIVRERYGLTADAEITIEANPGPDERGDAEGLAAAGITRLSIGAQSFDPAELRTLGRRHGPEDIRAAVATARAAGIASVSLDLLYDVPGQTLGTWAATLEAAIDLEPDHISPYALTLDDPAAEGLTGRLGDHLPTTPGARRWREGARSRQDDDRAAAMYELADERLGRAGFDWYEISNWARPGHEGRHNLAYWQRAPHEAVGPGAHAFDGRVRRWNAAGLDGYVRALHPDDEGVPTLPPGGEDRLDTAMEDAERVVLGLRTRLGIPAALAASTPLRDHAGWAIEADLMERTPDDRLVLTVRGRLLSNELFSRVM